MIFKERFTAFMKDFLTKTVRISQVINYQTTEMLCIKMSTGGTVVYVPEGQHLYSIYIFSINPP
jgi:hypothetical protein